jgi:heme oxygenase
MIMATLKEQTKAYHEKTERLVNLTRRLENPASYLQLLSRLFGFYTPLETQIETNLRAQLSEAGLNERKKSHLLVADLQHLGLNRSQIEQLPLCNQLPQIASTAQVFGCLYVLEGATLGGQIIRKEALRQLGFTAENGCSFFAGYGDRTMTMWRSFGESAEAFVTRHPDSEDAVVSTAKDTFVRFGEWVGESVP